MPRERAGLAVLALAGLALASILVNAVWDPPASLIESQASAPLPAVNDGVLFPTSFLHDTAIFLPVMNPGNQSARVVVTVTDAEYGPPLWWILVAAYNVSHIQSYVAGHGLSYQNRGLVTLTVDNESHTVVPVYDYLPGAENPRTPNGEWVAELEPGLNHLLVTLNRISATVQISAEAGSDAGLIAGDPILDRRLYRVSYSDFGDWDEVSLEVHVTARGRLATSARTVEEIHYSRANIYLSAGTSRYVDLELQDSDGKRCWSRGPDLPVLPVGSAALFASNVSKGPVTVEATGYVDDGLGFLLMIQDLPLPTWPGDPLYWCFQPWLGTGSDPGPPDG